MLFNELAIITPEKTRLLKVEYDNGHVVVEGIASEPKMVTAILDNIKASITFKNVSFKGSNKMANEEAYTFTIEADVL
jgi:Tfp pilus assembly protein PilN